ncbi:hypothetical protein J6590_068127 [Homalodisca vitripennis]|nr:hypothetical protein J6590_068127 [Homalodisca vitripennis]
MKSSLQVMYWPSSRSNIWQRSLHPSPRKFSIRKEINGSTTLQLDAGPIALAGRGHSVGFSAVGRLAASVPLTALTGTLPKVGELASHGETGRTENSQNTVSFSELARASAGAGEQLVGKLVKVNQLTSTRQKINTLTEVAEVGKIKDKNKLSKLSPGSTSPTKKGATPNKTSPPTERRTNKLWHRKREVENPNRKRSPEQEADKTRSS